MSFIEAFLLTEIRTMVVFFIVLDDFHVICVDEIKVSCVCCNRSEVWYHIFVAYIY